MSERFSLDETAAAAWLVQRNDIDPGRSPVHDDEGRPNRRAGICSASASASRCTDRGCGQPVRPASMFRSARTLMPARSAS